MADKRLHQLKKEIIIRESSMTVDSIIERLSIVKNESNVVSSEHEALLCLAHEVKKIKEFLVI